LQYIINSLNYYHINLLSAINCELCASITFLSIDSGIKNWIVQLTEYCVGFLETRLI